MASTTGFERDNTGAFIRKGPLEVMDYTIDFTNFLTGGDLIDTHTFTADTGITVDSSSKAANEKSVSVVLSGGTAGTAYTIKCTITTDNGLTVVRRFRIKCEEIHL